MIPMKKSVVALVLTAGFYAAVEAAPITGQGIWESTLAARDINGDGAPDAYYDKTLDVTWLADANFAKTSGWASTFTLSQSGLLYWGAAEKWVGQLDIYGITGWRLPDINPLNSISFDTSYSPGGTTDLGSNITSKNHELSHLFYVTLGNIGALTTDGSNYTSCFNNFKGTCLQNTGPFLNMKNGPYWYGERYGSTNAAWFFSADVGATSALSVSEYYQAWAVHDGDVSPVPEPKTWALLLAGLGVIGGVIRRRRQAIVEIGKVIG